MNMFYPENIESMLKHYYYSEFTFIELKRIIPSYFYSTEKQKSRGLGFDLDSQPYLKMLKNVHHSSNLCILSYIVIEDHFLFISLPGESLEDQTLIFFILKFFISKKC